VVAADVEEAADLLILAAHDDDGLAGSRSWSTRPTICHVLEKTLLFSSAVTRSSTYQGAGIVQAFSIDAEAS
jgi:hypothetical protein